MNSIARWVAHYRIFKKNRGKKQIGDAETAPSICLDKLGGTSTIKIKVFILYCIRFALIFLDKPQKSQI